MCKVCDKTEGLKNSDGLSICYLCTTPGDTARAHSIISDARTMRPIGWFVMCEVCTASTDDTYSKEEAIAIWNKKMQKVLERRRV